MRNGWAPSAGPEGPCPIGLPGQHRLIVRVSDSRQVGDHFTGQSSASGSPSLYSRPAAAAAFADRTVLPRPRFFTCRPGLASVIITRLKSFMDRRRPYRRRRRSPAPLLAPLAGAEISGRAAAVHSAPAAHDARRQQSREVSARPPCHSLAPWREDRERYRRHRHDHSGWAAFPQAFLPESEFR